MTLCSSTTFETTTALIVPETFLRKAYHALVGYVSHGPRRAVGIMNYTNKKTITCSSVAEDSKPHIPLENK
jgi:hypothetical protein